MNNHDIFEPVAALIQNAADAVRARSLLEGRADDWGEIWLRLGSDDAGRWLEVEDNGIGMSRAMLEDGLLSGRGRFWNRPRMQAELPALAGRGFEPADSMDRSFLDALRWADRVEICTRRYDAAASGETWRLEVVAQPDAETGAPPPAAATAPRIHQGRCFAEPMISQMTGCNDVCMPGGGTRVRLRMNDHAPCFSNPETPLFVKLAWLAPCLEVTLKCMDTDGVAHTAVVAHDWLTLPQDQLMRRLHPHCWYFDPRLADGPTARRYQALPPLEIVRRADGRPIGRASLGLNDEYGTPCPAVVCVGGWRTGHIHGTHGIWIGAQPCLDALAEAKAREPAREAKYAHICISGPITKVLSLVKPCATQPELAPWAAAQRDWLCQHAATAGRDNMRARLAPARHAPEIAAFGVHPGPMLHVAGASRDPEKHASLFIADIERMASRHDEIFLARQVQRLRRDTARVGTGSAPCFLDHLAPSSDMMRLHPNAICIDRRDYRWLHVGQPGQGWWPACHDPQGQWPPLPRTPWEWVLETIARVWGVSWWDLRPPAAECHADKPGQLHEIGVWANLLSREKKGTPYMAHAHLIRRPAVG